MGILHRVSADTKQDDIPAQLTTQNESILNGKAMKKEAHEKERRHDKHYESKQEDFKNHKIHDAEYPESEPPEMRR